MAPYEELCPCNSRSSHSENAPYSLQSISCFAPLGVYSAVLLDGVFRGLLDSCHGFPDWFAGAPHYVTQPVWSTPRSRMSFHSSCIDAKSCEAGYPSSNPAYVVGSGIGYVYSEARVCWTF